MTMTFQHDDLPLALYSAAQVRDLDARLIAAGIIKRAMIAVDSWLLSEKPRVRMIMQVHDELVFEVHKDDLEAVAKKIHELMESSTTLAVPLLVEVGSGENWDQAH